MMALAKRTRKRSEVIEIKQKRAPKKPHDTRWGCASTTFYEDPKCPPNRSRANKNPSYTGKYSTNQSEI